jgi:hypothetical protein
MKFLHVSKDTTMDRNKFIVPPIHKKGGLFQHDFNMDSALYLSKATDTGDSMWLNYRRILQNNPSPPRRIRDRKTKKISYNIEKDINDSDKWLSGHKHYFDVDFEKHHIYVISNVEQLRDFYVNYGVFKQRIKWTNDNQEKNDKIRLKYSIKNKIIDNFIDNLDCKYKIMMNDNNKVSNVTNIRNIRNMPFVKISKNSVVIPKKGISFEFLIDVYRTKAYFDNIIGDPSDLNDKVITNLIAIDFPKMVRNGYNGLYYSTELFTQYDTIFDIPDNTISKHWYSDFIKRIDIGEFPECRPFFSSKDRKYVKDSIEEYIQWLGSDTMIVWKWIFD